MRTFVDFAARASKVLGLRRRSSVCSLRSLPQQRLRLRLWSKNQFPSLCQRPRRSPSSRPFKSLHPRPSLLLLWPLLGIPPQTPPRPSP